MTIVTGRGDRGQTDLAGGVRVSKASLRVECYGTVDELISQLGLARSICRDPDAKSTFKHLQKVLFRVGASVAAAPGSEAGPPEIEASRLQDLDARIRSLEAGMPGPADWTVAGEDAAAAAVDVGRAVCRRAERAAVRLADAGEAVDPMVIAYLNRLSDFLWLAARKLEIDAGVDSRLRDKDAASSKPWSPAW